MLQEKENGIEVVGVLSEVDVEEKKTSDDREYISGKITIKSHIKLHGEELEVEIPFNVFSFKYTKAGGLNPSYESIKNVSEKMTSIASCGDETKASYIRVYQDKGGIRENSFYDKTGRLVETARPQSGFFNLVPRDKYEDKATFQSVIFILAIEDEIDRDGVPTGCKKIKGAMPGYNGTINVVDYKVDSKQAIEHIESFWSKGDTVKVYGAIAYTVETQKIVEEVGFGDPIEKIITRNKKELIITSGSPTPLDAEEAFDSAEMVKAMAARKAELEKKKEEASKPAPVVKATATESDWGF
jgi:hypothetical protein